MAITYDINIRDFEVQFAGTGTLSALSNIVVAVKYALSGKDTSATPVSASEVIWDPCNINLETPVVSAFTAFDNLTKAKVLKFMKAAGTTSRIWNLTAAIAKTQEAATEGISAKPW
jgi:hypothetical protein